MSTVVSVASTVNELTNLTYIFAVNASRHVYTYQDPNTGQSNGWTTLPIIPGSATPISLAADYNPQQNIIVLTVAMGDNTAYVMLNPYQTTPSWIALSSIPTT